MALRDGHAPHQVAGRKRIEAMWQQCASFLDQDLHEKARGAFVSAWWELYVAFAVSSNGFELVPRARRVPARHGPDLQLTDRDIWIEAVAPGPGAGADGVPIRPNDGGAYAVPDEQLKLRLRSAIEDKHNAFLRYEERGWVKPDEPAIVAVGGAALGYQWLELEIPRIVRVVVPIGHKVLHVRPMTAEVVGTSYEYTDAVAKASGAEVDTDIFVSDSHRRISAILYSDSDPVNFPDKPGADFVAVLNPHASAPLPLGHFAFAQEYWIEGDQLHRRQPGGT